MTSGRAGLALPLVLMALSVTGVLVAGLTWVGLMEARSGRGMLRLLQAQSIAETGAYRAAAVAVVGGPARVAGSEPGAGDYQVDLTAMAPGLVAVRATGTAPGGLARQEVMVLVIPGDPALGAAGGPQVLPERSWIRQR